MPAIFPPAYFAPISYFQRACQWRQIILEVWDTYPKQTLRNRMTILSPNGLLNLSIPVEKPFGSKTTTKDVRLSSDKSWRMNHWRALQSAYASSPFFEHYESDLKDILFNTEQSFLLDLNIQCLEFIQNSLNLPIQFELSKTYEKNPEPDFRNVFESYGNEQTPFYQQVFSNRDSFEPDLSILDALMNLGPMTRPLLVNEKRTSEEVL